MVGQGDGLADARVAVAAGDWPGALSLLGGSLLGGSLLGGSLLGGSLLGGSPEGESDPERLELMAAALYGTGDLEATLAAWEEIHALHRRRGEMVPAARAAAMVATYLMMDTGLLAPVRGWLARVDRLLADQDETPVHGLAAMVRGYERFMAGDMDMAGIWAERAIILGDRHEVVPAMMLGRVAAARVQIFAGDVADGIASLDDVAVTLASGEVDPLTMGMVYCELICAMHGLGEYDRADEWTRTMDLLRGRGVFFGGINGRCRVHRAEMLRLKGDCAQAEDEALHACEELRPWMRREFGWPLTELGTIRLRRGDLAGADEAFRSAHANGWDPQPGLALLRLAQGEVALAFALIQEALDRPSQIPWKERPPSVGLTRVPMLDAYVPIAVAAKDLDAAGVAAAELSELATRYGSRALRAVADLARARVSLAQGQLGEAVASSRAAVDSWCAIGAPFEAATARQVLARALRESGHDDLAAHEDDAAVGAFADIGATPIAESPPPHHRGSSTSRPPDRAVFRSDGDTRTIVFAGRSVVLRDLKGMRYLQRLLAEPGREFHVLDLSAIETGSLPLPDGGDTGPMIDDRARRAYQRRLAETEEDIAEAEALGDIGRAALAKADRDFIVEELTRAFGLGGRARRTGSTSERARTSVTRSMRYAIDRISEQHPELCEHLATTVHTGIYCSYTPDPRVPISWETGLG